MSAAAGTFAVPGGADRGASVRWPACLALVLALHAAVALALLRSADPLEPSAAPPEAITVDLAPVQEEPAVVGEAPPAQPEPAEAPPPPPEPVAEAPPDPPPEPVEQVAGALPAPPEPPEQVAETPPDPPPPEPAAAVPDAVLPQPPPPPPPPPVQQRPVVRPQAQQRSVAEERRPAQADARQAVAATPPAPAAAQPPSNAVPTWQGQLLGRLQRFKRYPDSARSRREEGVVHLTFAMDREGRVLAASVAKGSGFPELDAETLALVRRAEPLPPPPPEMPGGTLTLTVPVRFSLR